VKKQHQQQVKYMTATTQSMFAVLDSPSAYQLRVRLAEGIATHAVLNTCCSFFASHACPGAATDGDLFSRICVRKAEGRYFTENEVMDTFIQVRAEQLACVCVCVYADTRALPS
jgi:hypothetical protein